MTQPVVIVTGAAGGIGSATVAELARREALVLAADLDRDGVEALAARLGDGVTARQVDVSDEEAVAAMVAAAQARHGRLDGIFNNAGIAGPIVPIEDCDLAEFRRTLDVNLTSAMLGMKYAVPAMREAGGGRIVNTASTGGLTGAPELPAYIASKHAVVGLTRVVALETAEAGIAVNALCPGMVATAMLASIQAVRAARQDEAGAPPPESAPGGRAAEPEEIARVATWLLLDAPAYLTGAAVPVDQAYTAQ